MYLLEKHFNYTKRTTLNRMRKNKANPFKILISCLLSLRSRDETTEKISNQLFQFADTPKKLIAIPLPRLKALIYSTGHYHKKAKTLKHVSKELITRFHEKVPNNKQDLLSIKGIGPKTANIVLCFAYNQTVIPVDVNVHRVANRLGIINTKYPEKSEEELEKILPKKYWKEINGLFILHGKNICVPISPKCSICPLKKYCPRINIIKSR